MPWQIVGAYKKVETRLRQCCSVSVPYSSRGDQEGVFQEEVRRPWMTRDRCPHRIFDPADLLQFRNNDDKTAP